MSLVFCSLVSLLTCSFFILFANHKSYLYEDIHIIIHNISCSYMLGCKVWPLDGAKRWKSSYTCSCRSFNRGNNICDIENCKTFGLGKLVI